MALEADKHLYCEWRLGNGLAAARQFAALASAQGVVAAVGTQARIAIEIRHLRDIIASGFVGEVLSTTLSARGKLGR
jgi:predicted dehydrogenase